MKVVVLVLCLALVVGDRDTTSEPDIFCRAVSIGLNPVIQNCQTLKNENDPDTFCADNCSQQLAQALYDCDDPGYAEITISCAKDPVSLQFCGAVKRNQTALANLNASCPAGSENCSEECQTAVDGIGCCVNYIGSDDSVSQCSVRNCTTIGLNTSRAEALQCYRSRLRNNSTLDKCHGQLLMTLSLDEATITSFCDGRCPTAVTNSYSECGLSNFARAVENGCERDERGRYCGNIVHTSEFETLVDRAILACEGTDCTSGICEAAIDEIGCCLALDAEVNATVSTSLPISQCGVMHCPPFSSASALYATPLMTMMALGILILL